MSSVYTYEDDLIMKLKNYVYLMERRQLSPYVSQDLHSRFARTYDELARRGAATAALYELKKYRVIAELER